MKLFCTASLCLMMLGLLAHGSSGDEMDGSIGEEQGAYPGNEMDGDEFPGYNGEEEDAYPGDDVDGASANEIEALGTMGNVEGRENLLTRMIGMLEKKGYQQRRAKPTLTKVITELCAVTPKLGRIFHKQSPAGSYKYDLDEAKHACEQEGATLASYHQLYEAWQDGLELCACGWLTDGTARYPMQKTHHVCNKRGIHKCTWQSSWNAWCFRPLSICG